MVVETSRSIAEVARELGLNGTTLGYWVAAYREAMPGMSRCWGLPIGRGCVNWNGEIVNWRWRMRS
jgi:hypothetical protein